ncbi:hypothetical protein JHK86_042962 [Glycine max]|nr:hypothetical protein JHK86_042962 [Glycine max]
MNKTHIIKKYHPVTGTMLNQMLNFNRPHNCMADLALPKFLALAKRGWVPNTVPSLDGIHNVVTAEIDEAKARVTRKYMTLEQPLAAKKVVDLSIGGYDGSTKVEVGLGEGDSMPSTHKVQLGDRVRTLKVYKNWCHCIQVHGGRFFTDCTNKMHMDNR